MRSLFFYTVLAGVIISPPVISMAGEVLKFIDPPGDDKGPGKYVYPSDPAYTKGSFDLLGFQIEERGKNLVFKVEVNALIHDPWDSKSWGGNGFSIQMAEIYIDTDRKEGSGVREALPGINAVFEGTAYWEKVVLISPQGRSRLISEINQKAQGLKDRIIIPKMTMAQGRFLVATMEKGDVGDGYSSFGYQVVMQSNEGFPAKGDLLTRKVNEYEGPHRFGGGSDYDCDPHILDILTPPAKGGEGEIKEQYRLLSAYRCAENPSDYVLAVLPMVYR